jgi:hypothetical protein
MHPCPHEGSPLRPTARSWSGCATVGHGVLITQLSLGGITASKQPKRLGSISITYRVLESSMLLLLQRQVAVHGGSAGQHPWMEWIQQCRCRPAYLLITRHRSQHVPKPQPAEHHFLFWGLSQSHPHSHLSSTACANCLWGIRLHLRSLVSICLNT